MPEPSAANIPGWHPKITRERFEQEYAARGGQTVEQLHTLGRRGYPCVVCNYDLCEGWQMLSRESAESEVELGRFGREWLDDADA